MIYLFIGEDSSSKDAQLARLKQEFLGRSLEQFNFDRLYAKETSLKALQEKLLLFPVKNPQRMLVIQDAQNMKEDARAFLLEYAKKPDKRTVLILDFWRYNRQDEFASRISKYAKVIRFKEEFKPDTFTLSRQISSRNSALALKVLNQLLKEGERPERILGGLRYAWEKESAGPLEMKKKLRLLINCDLDIKTGRLKPGMALEKLVIQLCGL